MKRGFLAGLGLDDAAIDAIMAEHGAEVAALKSAIEDAQLDELVAQTLESAGMNPAAIPIALKRYDRAAAELKDGELADPEKLIEQFKSEWGDFFGVTETLPTMRAGTPPAQTPHSGTMTDFILTAAGKK